MAMYTFFTSLWVQPPRMCPIESGSLAFRVSGNTLPLNAARNRYAIFMFQRAPNLALRVFIISLKVTAELVKKALLASGSVCCCSRPEHRWFDLLALFDRGVLLFSLHRSSGCPTASGPLGALLSLAASVWWARTPNQFDCTDQMVTQSAVCRLPSQLISYLIPSNAYVRLDLDERSLAVVLCCGGAPITCRISLCLLSVCRWSSYICL